MKKLTKTLIASAIALGLPLSVLAATAQSPSQNTKGQNSEWSMAGKHMQHGQMMKGQHGGMMKGQHGGMMKGQHGGMMKGQHGGMMGGMMKGQHAMKSDPVAYQRYLEQRLSQIKDPATKSGYIKLEQEKLAQRAEQMKMKNKLQLKNIELMQQILSKQAKSS